MVWYDQGWGFLGKDSIFPPADWPFYSFYAKSRQLVGSVLDIPKIFFSVNLFPSRTELGLSAEKSFLALHFKTQTQSRIWQFLFYEFYDQIPFLSLCTKGNSLPQRIFPPVHQANAALTIFFSISYSISVRFLTDFLSKLKISKNYFSPQMEFYILFSSNLSYLTYFSL